MDLPEALSQYVPRHETVFLNVKAAVPDSLTSVDHPFGWILRVIQKEESTREEFEAALLESVRHLGKLPEEERDAWDKALYCLVMLIHHRRGPVEGRVLVERVGEEAQGYGGGEAMAVAKTLAEELIEEGIARGIREGLQKGREEGMQLGGLRAMRELLLAQLAEKFGPLAEDMAQRVRALEDTETLERHLRRLIHAGSLEEMGI